MISQKDKKMLNEMTNSIIDYASALERIGGDREFLDELLGIYQEEFDLNVGSLDLALQAQDFTAIQEIGHSLKGSSANLSLIQLRDQAYLIETAGRESDLALAKRSAEELKKEYRRLKQHLEEKNRSGA
jgi:HPt (histidine-containing phosphotransfer) domain-containing protein